MGLDSPKTHKRLNMNAFNVNKTKEMCEFSAYVTFNKATDGQTDIQHEKEQTLISLSPLKIAVEMHPPSRRSSLEKLVGLTSRLLSLVPVPTVGLSSRLFFFGHPEFVLHMPLVFWRLYGLEDRMCRTHQSLQNAVQRLKGIIRPNAVSGHVENELSKFQEIWRLLFVFRKRLLQMLT